MKQKFIDMYMAWADRTAQLSHARRLQVGAVIVKDDSVISYGYNGMPAGWDNDCEDEVREEVECAIDMGGPLHKMATVQLVTKPEVLHAESNAIAKLAKSTNSGLGATMFVTHAPCMECAKLIYQSGIGHVLYRDAYRDTSGITFLKKSGVTVEQI
jgi:dCMP deaminase